jgi:hypothetical protein
MPCILAPHTATATPDTQSRTDYARDHLALVLYQYARGRRTATDVHEAFIGFGWSIDLGQPDYRGLVVATDAHGVLHTLEV